jgi:CubicO group peptidase (beta-lactamase class C family)
MTLTGADRDHLRALFDRQLKVGLHHGAQLAVYHEGDLVVDFAGGQPHPDGGEETSDQRHVLFSCTKPYAGAAVHRLAGQGELDYDDPLVEYWPAFAEEGSTKAGITVRQVLSHQSGIPFGEFDEQVGDWADWEAAVAAMEDIEPVFEPGTQPAYHAMNYGWLVGELVRRVTGQSIREYCAEHVFEPLGMDDTGIGLAPDEDPDVATLHGFAVPDRCREPADGLEAEPADSAALFNSEAIQRAIIPAANGVGTARDMARFYACIANGGELDGTRILAEETVAEATRLHAEAEVDGTLERPSRYALGFAKGGLPTDRFGTVSHERQFGHGGLGSSFAWGDPQEEVAFAYVTNGIRDGAFEHHARVTQLVDAVRELVA